jgi:GcrA cell cycle regulator
MATNQSTGSWNAEQMTRLERLYRNGVSFREIAADIGVTRNAVIGKVHRMQLPTRDVILKAKPVVVRPPKPHRTIFKVKKPKPEPDPVVDYSCIIIDLTNTTCRYPLWTIDAVPFAVKFYCGAPGADMSVGQPYCRKHALMCNPQRQ